MEILIRRLEAKRESPIGFVSDFSGGKMTSARRRAP